MQSENEGLREKLSSLEIRVISLKTSQKMLEQYGRRNNTKISGIPDSVELTSLEEKVLSVFSNISVDVIGEIIKKKQQLLDLPIGNFSKKLSTTEIN